MSSAPAFASPTEAVAMLEAAMGYLAAADPAAMAAETQAEALAGLERLDAAETAARAALLAAFTAGKGYSADGDYSPTSWLIHRTRITRGAAAAHVAWARRAAAHPQVIAALAEGNVVTESYARTICGWTDRLPGPCQQPADAILVAAATAGADLRALAELFAEIYARSFPDTDDGDDPDAAFEDRSVRVETTFGGAGVITGDLTPECTAVVTAVLDALSAPRGAEDTRTHAQRYHDGLQEAMRRLLAGGLLPERAGQPVKATVHVPLGELRTMPGASAAEGEWIAAVRGRWAAARAGASAAGGDGAAWLDGDAARAVSCDAMLVPVVTGEVDAGALDALVRLCVDLDRLDHAAAPAGTGPAGQDAAAPPAPSSAAAPDTARSREALQQAVIGKAIDLLSGPGGLASFLRTRLLNPRLAGPSLPLDVGVSRDIPAAIRHAVIVRARGRCEWAGGCGQPAAACEVHHLRHKQHGGRTSVRDCGLYCTFHHQVMIHRMGWTVALNPDGTTIAISPDGTKILRSHGPPTARAG